MKKTDKLQMILYAAAAAFLLSAAGLIYVINVMPKQQGAFVPPAFDTNAEIGVPEADISLGWSELWQEGMSFRAGICGEFIVQDDSVDLYFASTQENEVWLKLRIMDEKGEILGETGLIRPGEYIRSVKLNEIPEAGSTVTMKIMSYEPDTYYSCGAVSLNTSVQTEGED